MSTHFIIDFKKKSVSEIYGVMSTLIIIDNEKSILLVLAWNLNKLVKQKQIIRLD